jgi:hypothetical protein
MSFVAGWYADPAKAGGLRWWDGAAWTSSIAPSPVAVPAPPAYPPPAYPPPAYVSPSAAQPAYGAITKERWSPIELVVPAERTMATRALVWGVLSVPFFIAFPTWIMAITFGAIGIARANRLRAMGGVPVGRGRSIAGLVLGCVGAALTGVVFVALAVYSRYSS